jgi:methylated-DNA-[protein]-cysteine S-methyltransferase
MRYALMPTRRYGDIAGNLGKSGAARTVGVANHDNRIPLVVPCHRVVGSSGSLAGYADGLDSKEKLLAIETKTHFT